MTPAPITSEMNSYLCPSQTNNVGQELPRRSISVKVTGLFGGNLDFVLQNSGRPEHSDDVGVISAAQTGKDLRRALAHISSRARNFPLLPECACKDFDFGSQSGLVVRQIL